MRESSTLMSSRAVMEMFPPLVVKIPLAELGSPKVVSAPPTSKVEPTFKVMPPRKLSLAMVEEVISR